MVVIRFATLIIVKKRFAFVLMTTVKKTKKYVKSSSIEKGKKSNSAVASKRMSVALVTKLAFRITMMTLLRSLLKPMQKLKYF